MNDVYTINEYFRPLFSKLQCGFRKGHNPQLVLIENVARLGINEALPIFY